MGDLYTRRERKAGVWGIFWDLKSRRRGLLDPLARRTSEAAGVRKTSHVSRCPVLLVQKPFLILILV